MRNILAVISVIVALPGAMTALHFTLLAIASLFYREPRPDGPIPPVRFLVLIPAHNEELVVGRTLSAIRATLRARDHVLVVADRCTDRTAEIARGYGAGVLERLPHEEPGRAAARQAGIHAALERDDWDFIVMIDADSIVDSGFFDAVERVLASGAEALQARSEAAVGTGLTAHASLAAFALQGVLIPRGRDRLGLLVRLRGTGMVLSRRLVERYRFRAPASEDRWYGLDLCLGGVIPRHVETARLRSENVSNWDDAAKQRLRYEAGRMTAAKEFVGALLRRRGKACLEAAWELITPPYAIATLSLTVGAGLAWLSGVTSVAITLSVLLALLAASLLVALVQAGAGLRTWTALFVAPWYMLWKIGVQLRALAAVRRRDTYYPPTPRS